MKLLPKEFAGRGEVRGVFFTQLERTNRDYPDETKPYNGHNVALYERSDGHFEAINILYHGGFVIQGNKIPAGEYYGKGESWNGSCVSNKEKAYKLYNGMVKCLTGEYADLDE